MFGQRRVFALFVKFSPQFPLLIEHAGKKGTSAVPFQDISMSLRPVTSPHFPSSPDRLVGYCRSPLPGSDLSTDFITASPLSYCRDRRCYNESDFLHLMLWGWSLSCLNVRLVWNPVQCCCWRPPSGVCQDWCNFFFKKYLLQMLVCSWNGQLTVREKYLALWQP